MQTANCKSHTKPRAGPAAPHPRETLPAGKAGGEEGLSQAGGKDLGAGRTPVAKRGSGPCLGRIGFVGAPGFPLTPLAFPPLSAGCGNWIFVFPGSPAGRQVAGVAPKQLCCPAGPRRTGQARGGPWLACIYSGVWQGWHCPGGGVGALPSQGNQAPPSPVRPGELSAPCFTAGTRAPQIPGAALGPCPNHGAPLLRQLPPGTRGAEPARYWSDPPALL